jgi:hypothetical protein
MKKKDIHIIVTEEEHRQIKSTAALNGMTIKEMLLAGLKYCEIKNTKPGTGTPFPEK